MKKTVLLIIMIIMSLLTLGQSSEITVTVNSVDLSTLNFIEVYYATQPFSTKEQVFVDTGNNNFKIQNYSLRKNQCVYIDGKRIEKGDNIMPFKKYLIVNKWVKEGTRETMIGSNVVFTIETYYKK